MVIIMVEINFISKDFDLYIRKLLGKTNSEKIYIEDINEINEIVMNSKNLRGKVLDITVEDLLKFSNLKKCFIKNMEISDKEIKVLNQLSSLEELQLHNCNFMVKKAKLKFNIKNLAIINCYNFNTKLITSLKHIEVVMLKPKTNDMLKKFKRVTVL